MLDTEGYRMGAADVKALANRVQKSAESIKEHVDLIHDVDPVVARNAAWVMTHFRDKQIRGLYPRMQEFIDLVLNTDNDSLRRLILNIIERYDRLSDTKRRGRRTPPIFTVDTLRPDFLDFCMEHMSLPTEAPGIQGLCMKLAYRQCRFYPELLNEFRESLLIMPSEGYATSILGLRRKFLKHEGKSGMMPFVIAILLALVPLSLFAQTEVNYDVQMEGAAGSGTYTPYYLTTNRHGVMSTESNTGYVMVGVDAEHNVGDWRLHGGVKLQGALHAYSNFYLQECYGQADWKSLSLMLGSKELEPMQRDFSLSSGSLTWSGNSRPVPQLKFGTNRFISIPGTKDWLQCSAELGYGRVVDGNWMQEQFDDFLAVRPLAENMFVTKDYWYHHKRLYLRSNPYKHFVFTIGAEHAVQFGGVRKRYSGENMREGSTPEWENYNPDFKDLFLVLIPGKGDQSSAQGDKVFFYGNHLGNINLLLEYQWGKEMRYKVGGYLENPFEDGSGMRKGNGWDGLWGLEYHDKNKDAFVRGVVLEYLQTTHQSGPIHWSPENDAVGMPVADFMPHGVRGSDDYYNNYFYDGYAHYGMSMGSAMLKSPVYNVDHYLRFQHTRVKAWHVGVSGQLMKWTGKQPSHLCYRMMASYRKAWGRYFNPVYEAETSANGLLELSWSRGPWSAVLSYAFDKGELYGDNHAVSAKVSLSGVLLKSKRK